MDWALWFSWIMASTVGWAAAHLLFSGIPTIIAGAAIAALQSLVLRGHIKNPWRWGVFSTLGWSAASILATVLLPTNNSALLGPLSGLCLGIPQWLILKKEVQWAGWWIIMSLIGWTSGLTLLPGLLTSGALPGAWTGLTLIILLKYTTPQHPED
jgi:hypothetical protein